MKFKIAVCFIVFILLSGCAGKKADDYRSSFGFSSKLSGSWLIVNKDKLKENPDLINFNHDTFRNIDRRLMDKVRQNIISGKTEIIYSKKRTGNFSDNINIMLSMGQLIKKEQEEALCKAIPKAFRRLFRRNIEFYNCGFRDVAGKNMVYLNFEGVVPGTRSVQYQFQLSQGKMIVVTLTCKRDSYGDLVKVLDEFVKNVKLDNLN